MKIGASDMGNGMGWRRAAVSDEEDASRKIASQLLMTVNEAGNAGGSLRIFDHFVHLWVDGGESS